MKIKMNLHLRFSFFGMGPSNKCDYLTFGVIPNYPEELSLSGFAPTRPVLTSFSHSMVVAVESLHLLLASSSNLALPTNLLSCFFEMIVLAQSSLLLPPELSDPLNQSSAPSLSFTAFKTHHHHFFSITSPELNDTISRSSSHDSRMLC